MDSHEIEIIRLNDEPLFNARAVASVLEITGSAARKSMEDMEEGQEYIILTNSLISSCSKVNSTHIRKKANRGEVFSRRLVFMT